MTRSVRLPYPYPIEREPASLPPPPPGREEHTAKPTMAVLVSVTVSTMKAPFMVAAVASRPCAKPSWPLLTLGSQVVDASAPFLCAIGLVAPPPAFRGSAPERDHQLHRRCVFNAHRSSKLSCRERERGHLCPLTFPQPYRHGAHN